MITMRSSPFNSSKNNCDLPFPHKLNWYRFTLFKWSWQLKWGKNALHFNIPYHCHCLRAAHFQYNVRLIYPATVCLVRHVACDRLIIPALCPPSDLGCDHEPFQIDDDQWSSFARIGLLSPVAGFLLRWIYNILWSPCRSRSCWILISSSYYRKLPNHMEYTFINQYSPTLYLLIQWPTLFCSLPSSPPIVNRCICRWCRSWSACPGHLLADVVHSHK